MKERCNIALIPLTQGKYAIIDIWNCEWLNQWKWYAQKDGIKYKKIYRAVRQQKINEIQNKRKQISMGRFILNFPDFDVDHVDGNPLNNCESNLRVVTCRQNCQNMHNQRTSSYPGVSWNKNREKWQCHIRTKTKQEYLGSFDSEFIAFKKYKEAEKLISQGKSIDHLLIKQSSEYQGVTWHKLAEKWQAQIKINGQNKYLGLFENEHDAYLKVKKEKEVLLSANSINE